MNDLGRYIVLGIPDFPYKVWILFHKYSTLNLLFDQCTRGGELHLHFDALETSAAIAHQHLATEVDSAGIAFEFGAEIVIQVKTSFNDLATAIAFDLECMVSFFRHGG